ncbi:hypothetical protein AGMMS4956_12920 [Bacteroidia bacterium]|nr:hypothetical protein AGMMS4956_12920 [Bacteroidia bacterium]
MLDYNLVENLLTERTDDFHKQVNRSPAGGGAIPPQAGEPFPHKQGNV